MAPEFVDRMRGSRWVQAQPAGSGWLSARPTGSNRVQAQPARVGSANKRFPGKPGKPEKLGTPIYGSQFRVLSGGSNRVQAQPAGSQWSRALPGQKGSLSIVSLTFPASPRA